MYKDLNFWVLVSVVAFVTWVIWWRWWNNGWNTMKRELKKGEDEVAKKQPHLGQAILHLQASKRALRRTAVQDHPYEELRLIGKRQDALGARIGELTLRDELKRVPHPLD